MPVLAGAYNRAAIDAARAWTMFWCGVYFAFNIWGYALAKQHTNNHFISYVEILIAGPAMLWALSLWQTRAVARLTLRLIIPPFVLAWILLTLFVEDIGNFSPIAEPVYSMLVMGAAVYTLLSRGLREQQALMRQDWFWICSGMALHMVALIVLTPMAAAYVHSSPDLVLRAIQVRYYINVTAFLAITIGILCPRTILSGRYS